MLTLLEALDELNSKSESELTLDYLEELAKKVSIEPVPHLTKCHFRLCIYSGSRMQVQKPGSG